MKHYIDRSSLPEGLRHSLQLDSRKHPDSFRASPTVLQDELAWEAGLRSCQAETGLGFRVYRKEGRFPLSVYRDYLTIQART